MREVAERLAALDWDVLDLTLREFGLPTSESWNGKKVSYAVAMLSECDHDTLIEVFEHLTESRVTTVPHSLAGWKHGTFRLFVSHLADHKKYAFELKEFFEEYGIDAFVAHVDIRPTREWEQDILNHLTSCHALVCLAHEGVDRSYLVNQEIGYAVARDILVFSIRYDTDPKGFLARFQAIAGLNRTPRSVGDDVLRALLGTERSRPPLANALVTALAQSGSYEQSNSTSKWIEFAIECGWGLSASQMEELRAALHGNSQVSEAYQAEPRIRRWIGESV